ncbi:MAG TPA: hypothetical protein VM616_03405 [Gammaproteobacteria bacterium]|nr:hypothetical protein [Gammaproteobacteria bacterium]
MPSSCPADASEGASGESFRPIELDAADDEVDLLAQDMELIADPERVIGEIGYSLRVRKRLSGGFEADSRRLGVRRDMDGDGQDRSVVVTLRDVSAGRQARRDVRFRLPFRFTDCAAQCRLRLLRAYQRAGIDPACRARIDVHRAFSGISVVTATAGRQHTHEDKRH